MAEVSIITFSLRDDGGKRSSVPVYVPATAELEAVEALADALAADLDGVTGAVIEGISISMAHELPAGLKVVTVADSLNGMGGLFNFDAANTPYSFSVYVPAIRPSIVVNGTIPLTDQAIIDFVEGMRDGTLSVDPSDRFANDLLMLNGVEVRFRKY